MLEGAGRYGLAWWAEEGGRPFLHPGRAASILAADERKIGWLGELHPLVTREWDLTGPAAAFELDIDAVVELVAGRDHTYRDVTGFPAVLQDIAVVVGEELPAARVVEAVRSGGGALLERAEVFDLYRGEQVGEGHKSPPCTRFGPRPTLTRRGDRAPRCDRARVGRAGRTLRG